MNKLICLILISLTATIANAECTTVIGFSQTGQYYVGAEKVAAAFRNKTIAGLQSVVNNDKWQLLFKGGAGIDLWADPNYEGWDRNIKGRCRPKGVTVDRVILNISSADKQLHTAGPQAWADVIDKAVTNVRGKFPFVQEIVLQAVIGGPNNEVCMKGGSPVRDTTFHSTIDSAIELVVDNHSTFINVIAGISPEVENCKDFRDNTGHLHGYASDVVGRKIGKFYTDGAPPPTTCEIP